MPPATAGGQRGHGGGGWWFKSISSHHMERQAHWRRQRFAKPSSGGSRLGGSKPPRSSICSHSSGSDERQLDRLEAPGASPGAGTTSASGGATTEVSEVAMSDTSPAGVVMRCASRAAPTSPVRQYRARLHSSVSDERQVHILEAPGASPGAGTMLRREQLRCGPDYG